MMAEKFKVKKGDEVIVLTGRDKETGCGAAVLRSNVAFVFRGQHGQRHRRATQTTRGIVSMEAPLHVSNVAHIDRKVVGPPVLAMRKRR